MTEKALRLLQCAFVMAPTNVVLKYGYGFLFALPSYTMDSMTELPSTVNVPTLLIQIFVVLVAGGLVYLAFKEG